MDFILMIILGGAAGAIASFVMKSSNGILMDVILGVVGALIGGFLANLLGFAGVTGFNIYSLVVSVVGAVVLIAVGRMLTGSGSLSRPRIDNPLY